MAAVAAAACMPATPCLTEAPMILSQEQEMIRDAVREFARNRLAPFAAEWDRTQHFPREALKELAALGAFGVMVPEAWGGAGLDAISLALDRKSTRLNSS